MNTLMYGELRRMGREWRRRIVGCLFLFAVYLLPFTVLAQIKTTVTDNLVGPDGSPATGTMTISAAGTFQSADGHNVAQGWRIQIPVSGGSFAVNLIPNQGATPSGQNDSYTVIYNLTSSLGTSYWSETWFVPSTGPVGLAAVRTLPAFPATFLSPQTPNTVLSGPATGSSQSPATFRALVGADLPFPTATSLGGVQLVTCTTGQFVNQISTAGVPGCGAPSGGSGSGSVTSVGLSLPSMFSVAGSPVTGSGTLTAALTSQTANQFLASPSGSAGPPGFRSLVAADLPALISSNTTGNSATATTAGALSSTPSQCSGSMFAQGIATNGNAICATPSGGGVTFQVNGTNVSSQSTINFVNGTYLTASNPSSGQVKFDITSLPTPTASTLGGIESISSASHNWVSYIDTSGVPHQSQPAFSDISGTLGISAGGTGLTSFSAGLLRSSGSALTSAELSGDATTSGSNAVSVVKVNGAAVPASAALLASNSSSQITAVASYTPIVGLFASGSCSGYLKSDGTCSIPSGMIYPGAGVANSTGSAWGTSYSTSGTGTTLCLTVSCAMTTPNLGTPSAITLTNATGLPLTTGVSGTLQASNFPALTGDTTVSVGTLTTATLNVHGVSYPASPSANTVPVVTASNTVTYEAVPNAALANSATTVNSQTCTLGTTCTIPFQTNTTNNTSQAGINLLTSTTNAVGLTVTPTNSATNQVKFEVIGSSYTGNAATATALASTPSQCSGGQFATGIAASGNASCGTPSSGTSVNVNGSAVSSPNFNGTTPVAAASNVNIAFQVSGSSVSGEFPIGAMPAGTPIGTSDTGTPAITPSANQWTSNQPFSAPNFSTGASPPSCTVGTSGAWCAGEGTDPTAASGSDQIFADAVLHDWGSSINGGGKKLIVQSQPSPIHATAQTGSISTATLCAASAGACNQAGQYHIHWDFIETGTACSAVTAGSVTLTISWTDTNGNALSVSPLMMGAGASAGTPAMSQSFYFQTALTAAWSSGDLNASTNGTVIQYATTYTSCTTGTGTYQLDAAVTRLQ